LWRLPVAMLHRGVRDFVIAKASRKCKRLLITASTWDGMVSLER